MKITKNIKKNFPLLKNTGVIFLDNASTTQKPQQVIDAITNYYICQNANVHRGIYALSEAATKAFEETRDAVKNFINAKSSKEIIFTSGTTQSINLVAYTFGEQEIKKDDEIIISALEHHSNLVPWQQLAKRKDAKLKVIPLKEDLTLDIDAYKKLLNKKTKLVAISAMSNALGTIINIKEITQLAHKVGAKVLVDAAQSIAHIKTDVQKLDIDFLAFSGHKMLGPTGTGILYGKQELLEKMPPFHFGGDMISSVSLTSATFAELPSKFEAGTPDIANIIALKEAIKYIEKIGFEEIQKHDKTIKEYAIKMLKKYPRIKLLIPPKSQHGPVISFTIKGAHPHDIASILNEYNIAIRAGHHCAQPLMNSLCLGSTARISFYIYNTTQDIDTLEKALKQVLSIF